MRPAVFSEYMAVINKYLGVFPNDVEDRQCRWPCGDPRDKEFKFCGCPVEKGSYCTHHREIAYQCKKVNA